MWERTLQDLIRGLRANKKDEGKFIAQAIAEIRQEVKSKDMELKAGAVLKLTYLDMLGYDMSWASFHVVEVMSSPKIHLKSVGYLAAAQSFHQDTDVLMLTTNLLKKDLASKPEEVAVTLNGLSHIVTPDLARDLCHDLIAMLNHSKPHIRKRAVLAVYKVFVKYPEIIPYGMSRLKEKLDDPDPGVVAATVNVLCELVQRNPKDYLTLAPQMFHLMTTSTNNWMLIKIIKLFGTLTPYEPRLVRKLQPPITDLISTTPAISLLYECVHTCIIGGMLQDASGSSLARTCVTKLAAFLQDPDQNLKYIALLAMVKIVPTHPELVAEYQDMIISSVDDQDISIRMRALDLLSAMVSRNNLQPIVQALLSHLVRPESSTLPSAAQTLLSQYRTAAAAATPPKSASAPSQSPAYRLTLSQRILALGSQDTYDNVIDFEWYLSVLVDLAYVSGANVGPQIRDQLVDIVGRVRGARRYAVQLMVKALTDDSFLLNASEEGSCAEILWAAAWICGEHCGELAEPQKLLNYLLQPGIAALEPETIAVYLQAATKVFGYWAAEQADRWDDDDLPKIKSVVDMMLERCRDFATNPDIEVQERAAEMLNLFTFIRADLNSYRPRADNSFGLGDASLSGFEEPAPAEPNFPKSLFLIRPLSASYELNAVARSAQAAVPIPEGLDLDAWITAPPKEMHDAIEREDEAQEDKKKKKKGSKKGKEKESNGAKSKGKKRADRTTDDVTPVAAETAEERAERERVRQCSCGSPWRKAERLERLRDDPYYLIDDRPSSTMPTVGDVESIPVVRLDDLPPISQGNSRLPRLRNTPSPEPQTFIIDKTGEMPEGAVAVAVADTSIEAQPPPSANPSKDSAQPTAPPSSFPPYEMEDELSHTATPPPIKVTRAKKKGTSSGKKKRTNKVDSTSPLPE
ncbi:Ap3d1 protein [Laetiporus sulphureus 93-53]|uniref:AP-3 complex subunit delta n=1 Tax=Laetiporus sulphureus 93-53 TaxID=1314785 RepID=A0A165FC49_9APHY|nr:Ap3d1 protein [Laetiporus sulphureus 93-53]KZT08745.1 Ap3d1 protein [Laetiporus sulphureus 93-53]